MTTIRRDSAIEKVSGYLLLTAIFLCVAIYEIFVEFKKLTKEFLDMVSRSPY